jgi:hypothetical protein
LSALGDRLSEAITMIVSGHVHLFEVLSFGGNTAHAPAQLVVGNGGVKLAKEPDTPAEINGNSVKRGLIVDHHGYMVWDRSATSWKGQLNSDGSVRARCTLIERDLRCEG